MASPPLFDLSDAAFRVQRRADGLHIERRFRVRAMAAPLGVGIVLVLVTAAAWRDGSWWSVSVLGFGLFLWAVFDTGLTWKSPSIRPQDLRAFPPG